MESKKTPNELIDTENRLVVARGEGNETKTKQKQKQQTTNNKPALQVKRVYKNISGLQINKFNKSITSRNKRSSE